VWDRMQAYFSQKLSKHPVGLWEHIFFEQSACARCVGITCICANARVCACECVCVREIEDLVGSEFLCV